MSSYPKRGEVFWVKFDPSVGTEIKKTRPAVVISNNGRNQYAAQVIIVPLSASPQKIRSYEIEVEVDGVQGKALPQQIRCVDKQRLGKKIGELDAEIMLAIENELKIILNFH